MKNEILLTDVLDYAKQNSVTKNELLYLLQMYNSYKKDKTDGEELTTEDLIRNIAIVNDDLKHGSDTRLVVSRVTEELNILNEYEFNDIVTLENVIVAIQRAEMVMKIVDEVQRAIYELGEEGRLLEMQLEELIGDLEEEELLIIKDYIASGKKKNSKEVLQAIQELSHDELMRPQLIARILGYEDFDNYDEVGVYTKGYRILNKIPRMPSSIVENLVKSFKSFQHILDADIPKLDEVEGIGEIRARTIKQSLKRMQEQFVFDNLML